MRLMSGVLAATAGALVVAASLAPAAQAERDAGVTCQHTIAITFHTDATFHLAATGCVGTPGGSVGPGQVTLLDRDPSGISYRWDCKGIYVGEDDQGDGATLKADHCWPVHS